MAHVRGHEASEDAAASSSFNRDYCLAPRMFCETGTGNPLRPDNPHTRIATSDIT